MAKEIDRFGDGIGSGASIFNKCISLAPKTFDQLHAEAKALGCKRTDEANRSHIQSLFTRRFVQRNNERRPTAYWLAVNADALVEFASVCQHKIFDTIGGRAKFTVASAGDTLEYALLSTNKPRKHDRSKLELVCRKFLETHSFVTTHYPFTQAASYTLRLIKEYVGDDPALRMVEFDDEVQQQATLYHDADAIEREIEPSGESEGKAMSKFRKWQTAFKKALLVRQRCEITQCDIQEVLIGSHIKPWAECEPEERKDLQNGLLLSPNADKAFEVGLISFDDDGTMILKDGFTKAARATLGIPDSCSIAMPDRRRKYMRHHRERCKFPL